MPRTESKAHRVFLAIALIALVLVPQITIILSSLLVGIKLPQLWGTVEAQTTPPTRNFTVYLKPGDALFFNWFMWVFQGGGYIQAPYFSVFNGESFTVATAVVLNNYNADQGIFGTCDSRSTDRCLHLVVRCSSTCPRLGFFYDDLVGSPMSLANLSFVHLIYSWEATSKYQYIYVNSSPSGSRVSGGILTVTSGSATGYGSWIGKMAWEETFEGYMFYLSIFNASVASPNVSSSMFLQGYMNYTNMIFMVSPTFFNGTHYRDIAGGYYIPAGNLSNVFLAPTPSWYFNYTIIRGMYSDGKIHLIYTPNITKINIYDESNNLVTAIDLSEYTPNAFGMVEDLPISLPEGTYTISVQSSLAFILGVPKIFRGSPSASYEPRFIPTPLLLRTLYVVNGSPAPNTFVNISRGSYYVYGYTDASGNFLASLPPSPPAILNITFFNGITYTSLATQYYPISPVGTTVPNTSMVSAQLSISPNDTIAPHLYTWYFDGVSAYIDIPTGIPPSLLGSNPKTVVLWLNPSIYRNGMIYMGPSGGGSQGNSFRFVTDSSGRLGLDVGSGIAVSSITIDLNTWNYLFAYWDGASYYVGKLIGGNIYKEALSLPANNLQQGLLRIGQEQPNNYYTRGYIGSTLIYSRTLSDSEINQVFSSKVIPSTSMVVFLDATFYNGTHYIDLSGRGYNATPVNNVGRFPDSNTWIYLVKNLSSDNLVHLRFFPNNSVLYIYNSSGGLVRFIDFSRYNANPAGMVEDVAINLPAGNYTFYLALPYQRAQMGRPLAFYLWDSSVVVVNPPSAPGNYTHILRATPTNMMIATQIYWDDINVSASFSPRYPVYSVFYNGSTYLPSNANISVSYVSSGSPAPFYAFAPSRPACYTSVGVCSFSYNVYVLNTTFRKFLTASFVVDDIYVSSSSLQDDGSIAPVTVRSVYDNALYNFSYTYYSDRNVSITPVFSGYAFPPRFFSYNVYNVSFTSYSNQSVFLRALAETNVSISVSTYPERVRLVLTGSPSIYIYLPNISSRGFSVFVDGRLWSNYSVSGNILRVYVSSTVVDLFVDSPYIPPSSTYMASLTLTWELGFIDENSLASYSFRAGALFNISNAYLFINASGSIYNKSIVSIPPPSVISLMWRCSNNSFTIWLYAVYTLSGYTQYYVDTLSTNVPSCPASMYIYYRAYSGSISLDRVGGTLGDFQRLLTSGELQLSISGPFSPSTIMRYILVDRPLVIEFQPPVNLSIYPNPLGQGITLRNMRGWLLSYSVSGVSVSNIQISGSSETISIPLGITLLVFVDPTSRTISLVQASPPPVVAREAKDPQQFLPLPAPQIAMPSISTITDPGIAIPVILGLAAALIIAGRQLTGSIGKGILIATAGMPPLAITLYIISGNPAYLGLLLTGLALGAAVRFARG